MKLVKNQNSGKNTPDLPEPPDGQQIPEFYSNTVAINYSPYEFELQHILVDSKGQMKGAINVRLSPQTAKSLLQVLAHQIAGYEEVLGEIVLPEGNTDPGAKV